MPDPLIAFDNLVSIIEEVAEKVYDGNQYGVVILAWCPKTGHTHAAGSSYLRKEDIKKMALDLVRALDGDIQTEFAQFPAEFGTNGTHLS